MSGRPKKKKKHSSTKDDNSTSTTSSYTAGRPSPLHKPGPNWNTKPHQSGSRSTSVFFGYDLPEHITPNDITSFMVKFKHVIDNVEVVLNEKWGNYARVTLSTSSDAHAVMNYYSGKYWPEFGFVVTLKPWKEKAGSNKSQSHVVPHFDDHEVSVYNDEDNFSDSCEPSHSSIQFSQSFSGSHFLPPYPGSAGGSSKTGRPVYSHSEADLEIQQHRKTPDHKPADSHKGRYKEYTIKLSGLKFDVDEKEIFELVKPFGDLTSRVRIASYPDSGVCYAYANYCSMQAALNAVSQLDESEFYGQKIHVCHRGGLGVEHSCKKELQALAELSSDSAIICSGNTTASVDEIKEIWGYDDTDVVVVKPPGTKVKAKIPSYASVVSDSPKLTKATSKSRKGPENKSKLKHESNPKRQSKPPAEQPTFSSFGKSGFKGLLPYPSIDAQEPQQPIKSSVHNQDEINSLLHDGAEVNDPPHDETMIKTFLRDEHVIETLPDYQVVNVPSQSDGTFINVLPHGLNIIEILPYSEEIIEDVSQDQLVVMASQHDETMFEATSNQNVINVTHQGDVNDHDLHLLPALDQVNNSQESFPATIDDVDPSCTSLQISNLHPDTSVQVLENHLKPYGNLAAPISIRYHNDSDSCSAVVRYDSIDATKSVMEKLDGSEFSGYHMCVVRGDGKTSPRPKAASNHGAIHENVSLIGEHMLVKNHNDTQKIKTPSPAKKNNSSMQNKAFPVIRSMSNSLQHYVQARLADKIAELQQHGGDVEWSENSVIVTGTDQQVLDDFDNQVLSSLNEFTSTSLTSTSWNKLTHVNEDGINFISQLTVNCSEVKIDLDCKNQLVKILGPQGMVLEVRNKIFQEIYQELSLLEYQMFVLITCVPNLVKDIELKFGVTVVGFVEDSNCLKFVGEKIDLAYEYVIDRVVLCKSREFPCSMDTSLVIVAIYHFKKVGIAVVVCNSDGQMLLPILLSNKNASIDMLVVHSLSVKEIDCAIDVLESSPHKQEVKIPSEDILPKIQESIMELQSKYSLNLLVSVNHIVIQGYAENDVISVCNKLQKKIDDFTIKTIALSFSLSKEEIQYLKHIMFVKPTEQAKEVLSTLSKSLIVKNSPVSIELTGTAKAIADGKKHINQELLKNFQVKVVSSRCHPNFLSQIDEFVRKPLEEELNVIVYYFPVHGSEEFTPTRTVMIYTKVYSTDSDDFKKACEVISKLDPKSHLYLLHDDEFDCIEGSNAINLSTIGRPYRVRIELRHNQVAVVLHAFTEQEAKDCFESLKQHISSLKIVRYVEVTLPELKFLQLTKSDLMKDYNVQVENAMHPSPKLKLEGMKFQVEKFAKHLENCLSMIVTKSHKCVHNKYLLMWRRCWQAITDEISVDKGLFVELNTSVSDDTITCEVVVVGDLAWRVDSAISSAKRIDGSVRECVIPTDRMGIKLLKEGLGKVNKSLVFHSEVKDGDIIIVSPYCTHAEEVSKFLKAFICSEKDKRTVLKKLFEVKYSFSIKKMLSQWNEVLEIAKSNKILSVTAVTDGIEVKGTESVIKQAEPHFLKYISSLESNITCSELTVDYLSRPALRSPEFVQLCKELQSDLPVSLTVQFQPEVLSSASVPGCGVTVEICEGSITLENSDVFINFTDENLTMSKELKDVVSDTAVVGCELHFKCHGPQSAGKAVSFNFGKDDDQKIIHAVLPKWIDGDSGEDVAIVSAVTDSLRLSESCNATSVSLPYISYIDKSLPIDVLAKACLDGIHDTCMQSCCIEKLRIVLPIDTAKKFQCEFMSGLFQRWITTKSSILSSPTAGDSKEIVNSMWLWKDDDGKYYLYQPEDNKILNQESLTGSSCSLKIGRFDYVIDFNSMTQTNTRTSKVRTIKCIKNDHVWMFKNDMQKWELFSQRDSIKIEAMYVTRACRSLSINGEIFSYHFSPASNMVQMNEDTYSTNSIKRVPVTELNEGTGKDTQRNKTSKILIKASSTDAKKAEERLTSCIDILNTSKSIEVQQAMVATLDKHIEQIQESYRVEISAGSASTEDSAKYDISGYKDYVQDAFTAVYQVLATTTTAPVQQSFPKPAEWEPQTDPIELKRVCEGSSEWTKILNRMKETIPYVEVVSIDRIQNEFLWEKYCQHKERMSRKGSERVNEKELFHGSSSTAPEEIYKSEEGFDMRFSRQGMWGQGNYFAESAKYSCSYAYEDSVHSSLYHKFYTSHTNTKQMFLAKVLTGDSYSSSSDQSLRMPPYKSSTSSEKVRYDTVNGVTHGSKIYITYSNDKAYPLYLISFR